MTATPTATTTQPSASLAADRQIQLTPGPTQVPPRVLEALARPIIHHRTKQFQTIFGELSEKLARLFKTSGPVLSIAGSGTTAFEAAQLCLAKPGSTVITVAAGKFGERWQDIYDTYASILGLNNVKLSHDWGTPAPVDQIEQALAENPDTSVVTVVHSETSTATASNVEAVAKAVRGSKASDALLLVDGVTSLGAFECDQDRWGIDALVTGSQKALMLPPGLGYVGLGERALARLDQISHDLPAYNLDLRKWVSSHKKNDVPFTPPVSMIRAQDVALDMLEEEGLDPRIERTLRLAEATKAAFKAMGLKLISESPSPSVTGAFYPAGVDDKLRSAVRDNHGIHLAGGQDGRGASWKGKIFRISHMGYVNAEETRAGLSAIETEMRNAGANIPTDAALPAFDQTYNR